MGDIVSFLFSGIGIAIILLIIILVAAIKVVQEYERGVIFRLGRLQGAKGPGIFFIIPLVDRMVKVDLRVVTLDIPTQEAITRDNVTVSVNAVAYFRVIDPNDAIVQVEDYQRATWQIAQTSLRSVLGQSDLDELLIHRDKINQKLQQIVDEATEPWGIKVSIVEVKDVELPATMKRAMARQAEAEREKRAKVIHAEGEFNAAQQLQEAAAVISKEPAALQLRYLQTLTEVSAEKNSTIIFPVPIEFLNAFSDWFERLKEGD
jgi:regulator of protease activity HflC (stomatin/prohibitin superfamily)